MSLTDFLAQIADSIRSKDGTTDAIKATDFPQRILDIPSVVQSPYEVATGEFVLSEDHNLYVDNAENNFVLNHGIGKVPSLFFLYLDEAESRLSTNTINSAFITMPIRLMAAVELVKFRTISRINGSSNSTSVDNMTNVALAPIDIDEENVIIGKGITRANFIVRAGYTYRWIAIVENEV